MNEKSLKYRNHRSRWTLTEILFVEKQYGKMTLDDMAAVLGRSVNGIRRIVRLAGIGKKQAGSWTEEEKAVLRTHYNRGAGMEAVQSRLPGRTPGAIMAQASKLGITGRDKWRAREKQFLKKHYGSMPTYKIAAALGRSVSGVRAAVNVFGLTKKQAGPWTEEEMAVLRAHYDSGAGIAHVQTLLPWRTRGAVMAQAGKMGITGRRPWGDDENRILREFYPVLGSGVTGKLPHRTRPAIRHQARVLGLKYRK